MAVQEDKKRSEREARTIAAMMRIYCHGRHGVSAGLCCECQSLQEYALTRLERCVFGEEKPTCARCPIHCYRKEQREEMRVMMRYAGPKMLWRHPILAVLHLLDGRKKIPPVPKRANPARE